MSAKRDAAAKGFTISAQMLQFILGLGVAIIVLFSLLFFFFRNQYERVAEQQTANLYNKIKEVCETGEPQTMDFSMPQGLEFQDYIKKKIGLSSNMLTDPYFYVYYEKFPPEPPYQLLGGVVETAQSVIAPWSEDLPWSSNLLLTAALDLSTFHDVPGYGKLKEAYSKGIDKLEGSRLKPLLDAGRILNKGQQIVLGNKKMLVGVLVGGTLICKMATDNSLETCAAFTAVTYFTARVATKVVKVSGEQLNEFLLNKRSKFALDSLDEFSQKLSQEGKTVTLEALQEEIEYNGQKIKFIDHIDSDGRGVVTQGDHWNALEAWWNQEGQPENIGAFVFEKDTKTGNLKQILLEKTKLDGPWNAFKENWNSVKTAIGEQLGSTTISPEGENIIANSIEVSVKQDVEPFQDLIKAAKKGGSDISINVNSQNEVREYFLSRAQRIRDKANAGYITLVEKGSDWENIGGTSESVARDTINSINKAKNDPQKAKILLDYIEGKEYKIGEKMKPVVQGTLGYTFLRVQDMYTPLGVTYWDKTISVYNNPFAGCGDHQLCLQFGYFVRKYDLPPECDVKLSRNSIVAQDPRFYLVSPCFSKLQITKKGSTVYVDPYICKNPPADYSDNPNYCYATSGYVDFYVTSETSSFFADCIGTGVCSIVQAFVTGGTAAPLSFVEIGQKCAGATIGKAIPGISTLPTGVCSYAGSTMRLLIDLHRESMASYPYVPDYITNSFGVDSNRYVDC